MRTIRRTVALLAFSSCLAGCDLSGFAAGSTITIFGRAAPALQRYADIELAEQGIPGSIATMEGLTMVAPFNTTLRETLAKSYGSFGYGFLEDHYEDAQVHDDEARMEHYRARASYSYLRARTVGFEMMSHWVPAGGGVEGHRNGTIEQWQSYLERFDGHEPRQVAIMFWAAYGWARYIGLNREDVAALGDLPYVTAMAERIKALDPTYFDYAPVALVAGLKGTAPAQMGGQPALARTELDALIERTGGRNLVYHVTEARIVAVALQDRELFRSRLQFVIDAGDVNPANRLSNQIAKRRAFRYLAQMETLFAPVDPSAPAASTGSAPTP